MKENKWLVAGKGLIVGATMIVPGVSGGTMAIILGIYDKLISAVSSFAKNAKENLGFLIVFAMGAGLGLFLFSTPLSWLLEHYEVPTLYFFIGAVLGGIPLIQKKSGVEKLDLDVLLYMLLGAVAVVLISQIPSDFLDAESYGRVGMWIVLLIAGIISAAALVLPGISFSHFLLILGLYNRLLNAIRIIDLGFLLPLGLGVLGGTVLLSRLLENLMNRYPKATYLIILGFIIGSIAEIFPRIPWNGENLICVIAGGAGFFVTYRRKVYF